MNNRSLRRSHRDYFEDFISRCSYHSNAIEGNTLTLAETYAIQWAKDNMTIKATARELYEAINHKYAPKAAMEDSSSGLTEATIKRIGMLVNRNINGIDGYRCRRDSWCRIRATGSKPRPSRDDAARELDLHSAKRGSIPRMPGEGRGSP